MRYSEMPETDSSEILTPNSDIKEIMEEETEDSSATEGKTNDNSCGFSTPLLKSSQACTNITNTKHRRKMSESAFRQCCSGNSLKIIRQRKSHSLPNGYSLNSVELLDISPDDYASQLTLLDLPIFLAIPSEELVSCSWNKRNKLQITPNIVAFTRRFNQVSFWTVQEILKASSPKQRAEIITHFIRICKKLYELNNFHSLFAIISALKSASIYRLSKSWSYLSRRDNQLFDKLSQVFSEEDNWKNLREHVESLKLPCIPYLGMFLTDLVYVDMAHPHTGGMETQQRRFKMNNILRVISHLQQSDYSQLSPLVDVQCYLNSIQYIEELQKFIEDDQYRLSLRLEPSSPIGSKESITDKCSQWTGSNSSINTASPIKSQKCVNNLMVGKHRKSQSLGSNVLEGIVENIEFSHHLLDDSLLEGKDKSISISSNQLSSVDQGQDSIILEGCLKKKRINDNGCHPNVSSWQRCWIQLSSNCLTFYSAKNFKGTNRSDFKKNACKTWSLDNFDVKLGNSGDVFIINRIDSAKVYKFRADNETNALTWYQALSNNTPDNSKQEFTSDRNLITFE